MKIPKILKKNNRKYKLLKIYKTYVLYEETKTKYRECFMKHDLGLIKDTGAMRGFKRNPDNVKI